MFTQARNINRDDVVALTGGCIEGYQNILSGEIKILHCASMETETNN